MAVNKRNMKVLTLLIDSGMTTEKSLSNISINDILKVKGITMADMESIPQLQEAIKSKNLLSYLVESEKADET